MPESSTSSSPQARPEQGKMAPGEGGSREAPRKGSAPVRRARDMASPPFASPWRKSHKFDRVALPIADRHYNRRKPGSPQFCPPGRTVVLLAPHALWVTSWPFAEYTKHDWPGAWINSLFRNEGEGLASDLIRLAVAHTRSVWEPPELGMVTFVDPKKVRGKKDPGYCYLMAGFTLVGKTKGGLLAWQMLPEVMPEPLPIPSDQASFDLVGVI